MDLGVLEGQTKGGYFSDSIFDPSVNQCIGQAIPYRDWDLENFRGDQFPTLKLSQSLAL